MLRTSVAALLVLVCACSSGSSSSTSGGAGSSGSSGGGACPNVAGTWKITQHCDASLVGQNAVITQNACALSFAAPFNGFTGNVTADGKIALSGPQTCTGTAAATAVSMSCTPGTCTVTLSR